MWLEPELKIHAPEFGLAWINSAPLTIRGLRGRVVLVDFWDYTCVNCIRTLPYVKEWHRRYHPKGLSIIGVHTPEFSFAKTGEYVARAVRDFGLEYPVVLDSEYQIWQTYANRAWPAKYLIDQGGYLRYVHHGEGAYRETEEAIQKLLREVDEQVELPPALEPVRDSDLPGARCYPVSPEIYLGFERGQLGNESGYAENQVRDYQSGDDFAADVAYLDGPWYAGRESVASCPLNGRLSRLLLQYKAVEVNLVMSPPEEGHGTIQVRQDGQPLAPEDAGEDVRLVGSEAIVEVREPRMYRLVKNKEFASRLLELSTSAPGLTGYAFTFVSCVQK